MPARIVSKTPDDPMATRASSTNSNPPSSDSHNGNNASTTNGSRSRRAVASAEESSQPAQIMNDGRRRSTRVTKKPATPYSTQPAPTPSTAKSKRKRPVSEDEDDGELSSPPPENASDSENEASLGEEEGDGDNDEDEDSEPSSDEISESEGEPDEEEKKERRRQNAVARAAAGTVKGVAKRGRGRPPGSVVKKPPVKKAKTASGAAAPTRQTSAPAIKPANGDDKKTETGARATSKSKVKGKEKANGAEEEVAGMESGVPNELYDSVFDRDDDHDDVASAWVAKYEADNAEAMKEMVNFILKCCGCDKSVTNYDIEDQDSAATTLSQIQEVFQKQPSADYPLTSKKPEFRKFRQILTSFLRSLIETMSTRGVLYSDPALIENIQVWITAMSSSTLRQFRHTSTVAALEIVSHLCQVAAEVRKANGTINRQLEAETRKFKKNEGRIKALEEKLREGEERKEAVENVVKDIFDTVFVHRYRDIDVKIRCDCVRELGSWILTLPEVFFDGSYLRYLGWVLSDTHANTRHEVLKALTKLFKKKDSVSGLRHFTERFRPRLVEMATRDADATVRASAVELLDVVREVGYLEPQDIDTVGRLLFDAEPKVRRAVVGFFVENINDLYQEKIEDLGGVESIEEALGSDIADDETHDSPTLAWVKMKCLVEVLASYDSQDDSDDDNGQSQGGTGEKGIVKATEVESRFTLAGQVLWEAFVEVRDWEGIAKYLLYDHSANKLSDDEMEGEEDTEKKVKSVVALEAKEDAILLQLLNASVATSIMEGGEEPSKKKGQSKRTGRELEAHRETVSRSLMKFIPALLKKFGPVPDAASSVLRLEQLMKLDVFQELRQSNAYASLLDDINRQFLTHADESVLKEASAAILHACSFEELDEITDAKLSHLKDETVTMLMNAVRGKDFRKGKFSDASLTELINTVRRLEYLASITSCVEMMESPPLASTNASASRKGKSKGSDAQKPIEILLELLNRGASVDELEEELIVRILKTLEYYFMWKITTLNNIEDADLTEPDIDSLLSRRKAVLGRLESILKTRKTADTVKISAASTLLNLSTLFMGLAATSKFKEDPIADRLASLGSQIAKPLQEELLKIYDSLEKSYAKASKRPLEPDENAAPDDSEDEHNDEESDEGTILTSEQRLCDYLGKLVLGILAGVVDEKSFTNRVDRNKLKLGSNVKEVLQHLDGTIEPTRVLPTRRGGRRPILKGDEISERIVMEDLEEYEHEEDHEEQNEEEHEEGEHDEVDDKEVSDKESEPDPEVEVPSNGEDEEMPDAD
ncbi:cohesin complex subunit [Rhizina undulata]